MSARPCGPSPTPVPCWSCAAGSARVWSPRWSGSKAAPLGLIANDPAHLGGAIDAESADKTAAFLQLCDAHGLPAVSL